MLDILVLRIWKVGVTIDWRTPSWFTRGWRGWLLNGGPGYRDIHATLCGLSVSLWYAP